MSSELPRIALFALGGTIASVPKKDGGEATPTLSAEALLDVVPQLRSVANISATTFTQTASGDLTLKIIHDLFSNILKALDDGVDGIVVTQGTDTLEETAYLLDLFSSDDRPIVVTGAMRNPGLAGPDGPANLLAAVQVAASIAARGLGALVVFADQIHLARYVRKTHSTFVHTFKSPNLGPVGWLVEGTVRIPLIPRSRTTVIRLNERGIDKLPKVAQIKVGLDDDLSLLRNIETSAYGGFVIESMGGGHLPSWNVEFLGLLAQKLPVVFASRTGSGPIYSSTYGFPGSETDLLNHGLLSAGILDGNKARLLLILLLANGVPLQEMQKHFLDAAM